MNCQHVKQQGFRLLAFVVSTILYIMALDVVPANVLIRLEFSCYVLPVTTKQSKMIVYWNLSKGVPEKVLSTS